MAAGETDVVSDTVRELTGHAPMTFAEFLLRYPASYRHLLPARCPRRKGSTDSRPAGVESGA